MKSYSEIAGDGGSRVVEQIVQQQNEIEIRLSDIKHLLAVGSGKGGVGKSSIAVQLALALHGAGKKVALLDLDLNGPSVARLCKLRDAVLVPGENGLLPPKTSDGIAVFSVGSVLSEEQSLEFESVSTGSSHTWRQTREFATLSSLLAGIQWGTLDVLLVDLPPGPERTKQFLEFFGPRLNLILVTLPSDISAGVVARGLSAVEKLPSSVLGYIENMKGYLDPETGVLRPLFPESRDVNIELDRLGELPFEPELASLCDSGLKYQVWSKLQIAKVIQKIAHDLWNQLESY